MSDILEDDLEFRGGTLQLSTDNSAVGVVENQPSVTTDSTRKQSQGNVHPSVLSGADSLTSSTNSFAGKDKHLKEIYHNKFAYQK